MRRVLRALGERGVFGSRELAFEPVQQTVDDQPLTLIELNVLDAFPETRYGAACSAAVVIAEALTRCRKFSPEFLDGLSPSPNSQLKVRGSAICNRFSSA